jgi:hypothetical protein
MTDSRAFLRHSLATLAYRGGKVVRDAPQEFANYPVGPDSRTPVRILAHIGDLMDWGLTMAEGREKWHDSKPLRWEAEVDRFFTALARLDAHVASDQPLGAAAERIFQGPIADALAHVGQLAMLRRLAGSPIRGENYAAAAIIAGRIGADQTPPDVEFG